MDGRAQLAELDYRERRYKEAEEGFRALTQAGDSRGIQGVLKSEIARAVFRRPSSSRAIK